MSRSTTISRCLSIALLVPLVSVGYAGQILSKGTPEDTRIQYAEALLELANVELQQAVERNAKVARVVPEITMERLRLNVTVAKELVAVAREPRRGDTVDVQLRHAEATARVAELDFAATLRAKQLAPESITDLELERLRLRARVARLRLQMWQDADYIPSLIDHMQWQIDRLSEEVLELHKRLEKVE